MLTIVLAGFSVLMFVIAVSYYRENEHLKECLEDIQRQCRHEEVDTLINNIFHHND